MDDSSTKEVADAYDAMPYVRLSYPYSHAGRLAVLGQLFGLRPAPANAARVLVLGCASGANLIPMAYALPGSTFLGVDLSARQIEEAQQFAQAVGLQNIELKQMDLRDLETGEPFDYIIAHGLHSWIPRQMQPELMAVCARLLAPQGILHLSYNTYPGGHLRQMAREMAQFHVRGIDDPQQRVAQTRALLKYLIAAMHPKGSAYHEALRDELAILESVSDSGLVHDMLEANNHPVHFWELCSQASDVGLSFFCESRLANLPALAADVERSPWLQEVANSETREQYLDFVSGRAFRRSLFCHSNLTWDDDLSAEHAKEFQLLSSAKASGAAQPDGQQLFIDGFKRKMTVADPLGGAALTALGECYPQTLSFAQLVERCQQRLGQNLTDEQQARLTHTLMIGYVYEVVDLRSWDSRTAPSVSDRPKASPVARYQLQQGWELTTLLHQMHQLGDQLMRDLISLLDGTRDQEALKIALAERGHLIELPVLSRRLEELRQAALLEA